MTNDDDEYTITFDPELPPLLPDDAARILAASLGADYVRDNDDGTFTHTFAPGEDGILNASTLE